MIRSPHIATPDHARANWVCPIARTFGDKPKEKCRGEQCPIWRWRALTVDEPGYKQAVADATAMRKEDRGGRTPTEYVNANRSKYGLAEVPYEGWCGLGGKPEG